MENCKIIYLARSDGVERENRPVPGDIGTADTHPGREYYTPISRNEEAYEATLKSLGTAMAIRFGELGKIVYDKNLTYRLADLPEKYAMYKHVRPTGAWEYNFYGHHGGRKKKFRYNKDFLHHLIWLATDETVRMDAGNCKCMLCSSGSDKMMEDLITASQSQASANEPGTSNQASNAPTPSSQLPNVAGGRSKESPNPAVEQKTTFTQRPHSRPPGPANPQSARAVAVVIPTSTSPYPQSANQNQPTSRFTHSPSSLDTANDPQHDIAQLAREYANRPEFQMDIEESEPIIQSVEPFQAARGPDGNMEHGAPAAHTTYHDIAQHTTALTPSPIPGWFHLGQHFDIQIFFIYRVGELVWLGDGKLALVIGLYTRRTKEERDNRRMKYRVAVLGDQTYTEKRDVETTHIDGRIYPFQLRSPPAIDHPSFVGGLDTALFGDDMVVQPVRAYKPEDAAAIAQQNAILASHRVDRSYTLDEMLPNEQSPRNYELWNLLYLGAEKIWVGDIIRFAEETQNVPVTDVLIVSHIKETFKDNSRGVNVSAGVHREWASLTVIGDVYSLTTRESQEAPLINPPSAIDTLPEPLSVELSLLNSHEQRFQRPGYSRTLTARAKEIPVSAILGRWYPLDVNLSMTTQDQQHAITQGGTWPMPALQLLPRGRFFTRTSQLGPQGCGYRAADRYHPFSIALDGTQEFYAYAGDPLVDPPGDWSLNVFEGPNLYSPTPEWH